MPFLEELPLRQFELMLSDLVDSTHQKVDLVKHGGFSSRPVLQLSRSRSRYQRRDGAMSISGSTEPPRVPYKVESSRARRGGRWAAALFVLLLLAYAPRANPFNWFVRYSSLFSERGFLSLKEGAQVSRAIQLLGEPLNTKGGGTDCPGCKVYNFMGDPPP